MNRRLGLNHLALPPPAAHVYLAPAPRRARETSSTLFVACVILAAVGLVLAGAIVLTAPRTVTLPIAFVLVVGLAVSALLVPGDGWLARRRVATGEARALGRSSASLRHDQRARSRAGATNWRGLAALAVASLALLLLALLSADSVRVALSVAGLAGLVGLRLAAARGQWVPRAPARVVSRTPPANGPGRDTAKD